MGRGLSDFGKLPNSEGMVAAPLNFRGDLKILDQNNWGGGGHEQKIKFFLGELNLKGDLIFRGGL